MKKRCQPKFHWIVAFLVFLEMIIVGGLINSASVFIIPVCQDLGISRSAYSSANIPYNLTCTLGTLLTGSVFHRFGYKYPAILALLLIGSSLAVAGSADSLVMYSFGRAIFGLGYGICFTAGATFIIRNWFSRHQGLVLGAVSMASGLGGSLMTVLLTAVTDSAGWRAASFAAAVPCIVTAALYLIIRDRPEQMGLQPLGFGDVTADEKSQTRSSTLQPGLPFSQLIKSPGFYLMILCVLLCCSCVYLASSTVVPHFQSSGFSSADAATYQSIVMLALAVSKLACGGLCDRFGAKSVSLICVLCAVGGEAILGLTTNPLLCGIGVLLLAIGMCAASILIPLLAQDIFGYRAALPVNSVLLAMSCIANILSSMLSGACFDRTGSYAPGYLAAAVGNALVALLLLVLFRLKNHQQA